MVISNVDPHWLLPWVIPPEGELGWRAQPPKSHCGAYWALCGAYWAPCEAYWAPCGALFGPYCGPLQALGNAVGWGLRSCMWQKAQRTWKAMGGHVSNWWPWQQRVATEEM